MSSGTSLGELLLRWEALRRLGETPRAEELCRDCPELLPELNRQIELRAIGPSGTDTTSTAADSAGTLQPPSPLHASLADSERTWDFVPKNESPKNESLDGPFLELRPGSEPVAGYRLVARLGRGGFGEVWKAIAPGGFSVALKIVPLQKKVAATELHSLEIIKSVRHPNLLTSFGAWQCEGHLIVAMELADGTLWDRYQEARGQGFQGIPRDELLEYLREAAKGIDYLNEPHHTLAGKERVSLQHRDIKPQNILRLGNGVKVADFGLIRLLEHAMTGHTGNMTPAYAAPEFMRGQTSSQSDQYCLAVSYCELRGGQLPFEGTQAQVLHGHLSDPPNLSMLPEAERPAVARALAKEPTQRWPSCRAFVDALEGNRPMSGKRESAAKEGPVRQAGATRRQRWRRMTFLLIAMAALILAIIFYPPVFVRMARMFHAADPNQVWKKDDGNQEQKGRRKGDPENPRSTENDSIAQAVNDHPIPETDVPIASDPGDSGRESGKNQAESNVISPEDEEQARSSEELEKADESADSLDVEQQAKATAEETAEKLRTERTESAKPRDEEALANDSNRTAPTPATDESLPDKSRTDESLADRSPLGELRRFEQHKGGVRSVALSPNGRYALSAGDDKGIWLWEVESGEGLHRFLGHTDVVHCVAFSPDGRVAISGGDDRSVRTWDLDARAAARTLSGHTEAVYSVAFASNNLQAVSAGMDTTVRVWNLPQAKEISQFVVPDESIWSVALSTNDRQVLTASDSPFVRLWDLESGKMAHRFAGHRDVVWCVAWSSDGTRALSGGGWEGGQRDYGVRLWDVKEKKLVRELAGHTGRVGSVAFSGDGHRAVSGGFDNTVRIWDVDTGDELHCFQAHQDLIYSVTMSHDGQRALSASRDGTVRVWGVTPRQTAGTPGG